MRTLYLTFMLLLMAVPAMAADKTDHPLLSAYAGSQMKKKEVQEYAEYPLFSHYDPGAKTPAGELLEGKVTRMFYKNPKERSVLEMFRNYEQAIKQAGAELLFHCNQSRGECVERYAQRALNSYNGISAISNNDGRYLLGRVKRDGQTAYLAVAVGPNFTQIDVVELQDMDTGMVRVNAEMLGNGLDADGFVVVDGIFFDTDKTSILPESRPALDEVAKLLKERSELKLYVVGHTDMQGNLLHNMTLSEGRAREVVRTLNKQYGISVTRLEGKGVGPLAPQASNRSEDGRAKNRRVVLVGRI